MWQLQGFGKPHYTNISFLFPTDPPNIPVLNETGSYWRTFDVLTEWDGQQLCIRFEGVDSAFHLWVNGQEVGYSQGSRNASEFDITPFVNSSSTNSLAVRVYKFCDGSYLEDQDQWWLSGIFRDVVLIPFQRQSIIDYTVVTELADSLNTALLKTSIEVQGDHGRFEIKLYDASNQLLGQASGPSTDTLALSLQEPRLWSAEDPYLYRLLIPLSVDWPVRKLACGKLRDRDQILSSMASQSCSMG